MRQAQFFVLSLVLVLISMFFTYMYIRSGDASSSSLFERSSALDMQNIIDSIQLKNSRFLFNVVPWWDFSWTHRVYVNVTQTVNNGDTSTVISFNPNIAATKLLTGSCSKELRVTNANSSRLEIESNVTASTLPCSLVRREAVACSDVTCVMNFSYYVYYGNANAQTPSYRQTIAAAASSATIGSEEGSPSLCNHFIDIYSKTGASIYCNVTSYTGNKTNVSLYYATTSLKFNGTIV